MKLIGLTLMLPALLAALPVPATEVFHWVDEQGVSHFSQNPPPMDVAGVRHVILEDTTPPGYDPDEDLFGIQAQAERMAALREEMAQKREAWRERQRNAAQQPVVQYRDRYYGSGFLWPYYPRPPLRPEPPIEVPYETTTLRPLGFGRN